LSSALPVVLLVLGLVARDAQLLDVGDDDVVAGIDVRGEYGLVLAAQAARDLGGQSTEHLVGSINQEPLSRYFMRLGGESLHQKRRPFA